jgi:hypothetical protein
MYCKFFQNAICHTHFVDYFLKKTSLPFMGNHAYYFGLLFYSGAALGAMLEFYQALVAARTPGASFQDMLRVNKSISLIKGFKH